MRVDQLIDRLQTLAVSGYGKAQIGLGVEYINSAGERVFRFSHDIVVGLRPTKTSIIFQGKNSVPLNLGNADTSQIPVQVEPKAEIVARRQQQKLDTYRRNRMYKDPDAIPPVDLPPLPPDLKGPQE